MKKKKTFKCGICDTKFAQKSTLKTHVKLVHEKLKPRQFHSENIFP